LKVLTVVNHYDRRPKDSLDQLLAQLKPHGMRVLVVINSDDEKTSQVQRESPRLSVMHRPNLGMNIGAWSDGYLHMPDFDYYLFLQDECRIENGEFLDAYLDEFGKDENLGMLGESINPKWLKDWQSLRRSGFNVFSPEHSIGGIPVPRVDFYLHCMKAWGIDPGETARHLRSLVWFLPGEMMARLQGFPQGRNKGECIAAEIGVSRKVEQLGYSVSQAGEMPFSYIYHTEWQRDGYRKIQ
jgi:hypothetical protein